jgi:hypothetical protein
VDKLKTDNAVADAQAANLVDKFFENSGSMESLSLIEVDEICREQTTRAKLHAREKWL